MTHNDEKNRLLLFQAGNRDFGMNIGLIRSIHGQNAFVEEEAKIRLPGTDIFIPLYNLSVMLEADHLSGKREEQDASLNLLPERGRILTETVSAGSEAGSRIMLLNVNEDSIALKADRILGVISVKPGDIAQLSPIFRGPSLDCFPQVLKKDGRLILLINPEGIRNQISGPGSETEPGPDPAELQKEADPGEIFPAQGPGQVQLGIVPGEHPRPTGEKTEIKDIKETCPLLDNIGSELDSEINLSYLLAEDKKPPQLENLLTRILQEDNISEMIIQICVRQMEETVAQRMGKVKEVVLEKLMEKGLKDKL